MDSKADIRRAVRMRKDRIDGTEAKEAAERCFGNVARCPEFQEARHILAYSSLPDEMPTEGFLSRWAGEKSLYLPRVDGDRLKYLPTTAAGLPPAHSGFSNPQATKYAMCRKST